MYKKDWSKKKSVIYYRQDFFGYKKENKYLGGRKWKKQLRMYWLYFMQ